MAGIFISYRTGDEQYGAALLDQELSRRFTSGLVFRAPKSIRPGQDFSEQIPRAVSDADVLLVVIGRRWLDDRRIDDPDDWVRREIRDALRHGVVVIPLLLDTDRPAETDLPPDVAAMARCQYLRVDHRDVARDMARIVDELLDLVPGLADAASPPPRPTDRRRLVGTSALVLAMLAAITVGVAASGEPDRTHLAGTASRPRAPFTLSNVTILTGQHWTEAVTFTADGHTMVTADDGSVQIRSVSDSAVTGPARRVPGGTAPVSLDADRRIMATGNTAGTVTVWTVDGPSMTSVSKAATIPRQPEALSQSVFLSPTAPLLAIASSGTPASLWDIRDPTKPTLVANLPSPAASATVVAISPDGRLLATDFDMDVDLWDISRPAFPAHLATLTGHDAQVNSITFDHAGTTIAVGAYDCATVLWDVHAPASPIRVGGFNGRPCGSWGRVAATAFGPDDTVLAVAEDHLFRLLAVADPSHPTSLNTIPADHLGAFTVALSPDGRALVTAEDDRVRLWTLG